MIQHCVELNAEAFHTSNNIYWFLSHKGLVKDREDIFPLQYSFQYLH